MAKTIKIEEMIIGKGRVYLLLLMRLTTLAIKRFQKMKLWNPIISCKFTI